MKSMRFDICVIGFALFSMFFGAGNVIFPPFLGLQAGSSWFIGFCCYYLADIGLALLALFAMLRHGGAEGITGRIGSVPSALLMSVIVLCIGPMVAIPRTAATTFELSVAPLTDAITPAVFSVLFFLLIMLLCLKESAVVDVVGKFLTPALLLGLVILIVKGVLTPLGPVAAAPLAAHIPSLGIEAGYQTMDVLATLLFGSILLETVHAKGYDDPKDKFRVVCGSGAVAGIALLVVYLGLTYLGASASTLFDVTVNRSVLVTTIVQRLLGKPGVILFAIVVALACITTATALVSAAASFFCKLSHGKLPYTALVVVFCGFSAVISNVGLDAIVAIAAPILNVVYPPALVLILLSFFGRFLPNDNVFRMAALGALLVSLAGILPTFGIATPWLDLLPFAGLGFGWILPAAVFGGVGWLLPSGKK
ncbi:MAG: branched-chain amino acid transport system II carrier protein [Oscillibacter sp.]